MKYLRYRQRTRKHRTNSHFKSGFTKGLFALMIFSSITNVQAAVFADKFIEYTGPSPIGFDGVKNNVVPSEVVLGPSDDHFLSLPVGSSVTVGFSDVQIINGPGNDIRLFEFFPGTEDARVLVKTESGSFLVLGNANSGGKKTFDLSDINYNGAVTAVKLVGRDNDGASAGFDLDAVQALNYEKIKPHAPKKLVTSLGRSPTSVILKWGSVSQADRYRLERAGDAPGPLVWKEISSGFPIRATQYTDKTTIPGRWYIYRVRACVSDPTENCSDPSLAQAGYKAFATPSDVEISPGGLNGDGTPFEYRIRWRSVAGNVEKYTIYVSESKGQYFSPLGFNRDFNGLLAHDSSTPLRLRKIREVSCLGNLLCSAGVLQNQLYFPSSTDTELLNRAWVIQVQGRGTDLPGLLRTYSYFPGVWNGGFNPGTMTPLIQMILGE